MSKEYFDEFEVCYENTHDEIITTQFKREGNRYLDRTVRRAYEVFKVQQQKIDEYILVCETLDELYVKEVEKNRDLQKKIEIMQEKINEVVDYIGDDFGDFYLGETNTDIHKILTVDLEQALNDALKEFIGSE